MKRTISQAKKKFGKYSENKSELRFTNTFLKQIKTLDSKSKRIIDNKLQLIESNPFHFKQLEHPIYQLYRIRLSIQRKETRLIYCVLRPNIVIICLLERKKEYKDLEKYLKKLENK